MSSRMLWQNWCALTNTTISASSEDSAYPTEWLRDPLRSKYWKSKQGWTIVAGFNDKLDFLEGTSFYKVSTFTPGTYSSGTSMAAQVKTKMNAVSTVSTGVPYNVTYSSTSYKFAITRLTTKGTFGLRFASGGNAPVSIGPCLGFLSTSDLLSVASGTASYTAPRASYQSRHYLKFDFGAARDIQVGLLHYSNIETTSATVKFQLDAADTATSWSTPSVSTAMTLGDVDVTWLTSARSFRYLRFVVDNTRKSAGYTYVGVPFGGEYLEQEISYRFSEGWSELSEVGFADQGAPFQLERDRGRAYDIVFPGLTVSQRDQVKQMAKFVKVGRPFFFCLSPSTDADDAIYVFATRGIDLQSITPSRWQISLSVSEALG